MVEIIYKIVKIFTALCVLLLSILLLLWVFSLNLNFTFWHLVLIACVGLLTFLFVSFSFTLIRQTIKRKVKNQAIYPDSEILDEDELKRHIKK